MMGHIVMGQELVVSPLLQCSERIHMRCEFCLLVVHTLIWCHDCVDDGLIFCSLTLACHCTPCCLVILDIYTGFTWQVFKIITTIDCIETTISAVDLHGLLKKFVQSCCSYSYTVSSTCDTLSLHGWMVHTNMSQPKLDTIHLLWNWQYTD
jgi:hypothetical protein